MIYIDLLVIQDFVYNYVILLGVGLLLKRISNFKKIFLSSVIGTISLLFLFISINNLLKVFIIIIFSIIMSIVSFSYKDIIFTFKNVFYMHTTSIFIAGGINLININLLPKIDSYLLNVIILILISPIITYIYIKSINKFKNNYTNYYKVDIYITEKEKITVTSFLDTGNKLIDPYKRRPIILLNKNLININNHHIILVPYHTVNNNDLLNCVVPNKIYINQIGYRKKFLIGLIDEINIEGVDCILNSKLLEERI